MTLGIVDNNLCMTSKLPIIKNKLSLDNGISYNKLLLYIVKKLQCLQFVHKYVVS